MSRAGFELEFGQKLGLHLNVMAQIFISYRRSDSAYIAATLNDKLQQHFGPDSVFFDVDNIPLGVDFREYIGNAVGQCDVLLLIIGEQWMGPVNSEGKRRIDDPTDYMRVEIESALKRKVPVIPVLVGEAKMPTPVDLPPAIESVAFRNATEIRAGRDLRQHIERLIKGVETTIKTLPSQQPEAPVPVPQVPAKEKSPTVAPDKRPSPAKPNVPLQAKPMDAAGRKKSRNEELLEEVQKCLGSFTDPLVYTGKEIPLDKLKAALSTYARGVPKSDVLLLYDNTRFGSAREGLLLASDGIYWQNRESQGRVGYSEIREVQTREVKDRFFKIASIKLFINQQAVDIDRNQPWEIAEALAKVIRRLTKKTASLAQVD